MITGDFQNKKIPLLGLGCMRLPTLDGDYSKIDTRALSEMVDYAIGNGLKYFDCAWGYHRGNAEIAIGEALKKYPRDSFYLATKFPGYDLANMDKVEEIFEEQLKKCQVEYFDFYLIHNVCEINIDAYLDPKNRIIEYLYEQKKKGRIRHLGFSAHGLIPTLKRFLAECGDKMEFCQLQLNWLDWSLQSAKAKLELMREYNLPVWVMEPLRGGKLLTPGDEYQSRLMNGGHYKSMTEWGFRFLLSLPEVTLILSGMSNMEQLKENIEIFKKEDPILPEEKNLLLDIANDMTSKTTLPCTACRYCTSYCPKGIDIPNIIDLYNDYVFSGVSYNAARAVSGLDDDKKPSACIGCRSCEGVCPQNIKISEMMTDFSERLNKK